jgi:hypothetical protein
MRLILNNRVKLPRGNLNELPGASGAFRFRYIDNGPEATISVAATLLFFGRYLVFTRWICPLPVGYAKRVIDPYKFPCGAFHELQWAECAFTVPYS